MGESIFEGTVTRWLKKPGDAVQQDETVLEIATDKVDSEIPSTSDGIIEEILFDVNEILSYDWVDTDSRGRFMNIWNREKSGRRIRVWLKIDVPLWGSRSKPSGTS